MNSGPPDRVVDGKQAPCGSKGPAVSVSGLFDPSVVDLGSNGELENISRPLLAVLVKLVDGDQLTLL